MTRSRFDLDAPEPAVRNAIFLIRLRSRLIRLESTRLRRKSDELRQQAARGLARSRLLCRRSRWLIDSGRALPRVVAPTRTVG